MIIKPKFRSMLAYQLVQNNPFYLISAACMLAGCLALTNSLSWTSIPLARLLILITTLNVYEFILLGLAVYLIVHRKLRHDGVMLLILEAFFLVDVSFLNTEIATANLKIGIGINAILYILAAMKLLLVARAIGVSLPMHRVVFVLTQIAALFLIPIVLRWMDDGSLTAKNFYAVWWIVGLMPVLGEVISRIIPAPDNPGDHIVSARVYMALPWISLIAHVGILHYVYTVNFYGADIAPLLIGLAVVMHRAAPTQLVPRKDLILIRALLPAAAVMVSLNNPGTLCFVLDKSGHLSITPTRVAVGFAYLTYIYLFVADYAIFFLTAGAMAVLAMLYGPTPGQIATGASNGEDRIAKLLWKLTPKTASDWGVVAVAAAFAFLGLGAAVSLRAKPEITKEEPPPADPPVDLNLPQV